MDDEDYVAFQSSEYCKCLPYVCSAWLKIDRYLLEIEYLYDFFCHVYHKFLNAIDHINFHPSNLAANDTSNRKRRSSILDIEGHYYPSPSKLTPSKEELLDRLLQTILEINPSLYNHMKRVKHFGLMTCILGWGIYSNFRSIRKMLQDKQIKELAKHLSLTMTQVNRHKDMLYELDSKLLILNRMLQDVMVQISYARYEANFVDHKQMRVNRIYMAIYALKEDIDSLCEYMRVLASQQLSPLVMPPDILHKVLEQVQEGIRSNAKLHLSEDPYENTWAYYNIIKVIPIVLEDCLMVILTIPLIDNSLHVNLYKVHNLPMLHLKLGIQVEYEPEEEYLVVLVHGMFATILHATDPKLCKMSQGHLCMLDHALYAVDNINWHLYALFTNDLEKIKTNFIVKPTPCSTNLAHSLDGYLWAVSSIVAEKLQIWCVQDTSVVTIKPPLQIIDIGNGCEAFSPNIYIPAKLELTTTLQSLPHSHFFQKFNLVYVNISTFVVFQNMSMATLTPEEEGMLRSKVHKLKPMRMDLFQQKLTLINEDYPLTLPNWLQLTLQIGSGATLLTVGGCVLWFCIRHRSHLVTLWKFASTLVTKLKENPNLFPHLLSVWQDFINRQHPPTPPPLPGPSSSGQCQEEILSKSTDSTVGATGTPEPMACSKPLKPMAPTITLWNSSPRQCKSCTHRVNFVLNHTPNISTKSYSRTPTMTLRYEQKCSRIRPASAPVCFVYQ